ncbi:RNA-dependent ATPase rok1 [Loxospora ochrophaea]|nr:RNA-dependent ATPase rok1 [Loxospora ochrophaea]
MDVFKILARSTSLQKSAPSRTTQHIPSAGTPDRPQSLSQNENTTCQRGHGQSNGSFQGTKRKRDQKYREQELGGRNDLDFFRDGPRDGRASRQLLQVHEASQKEGPGGEKDGPDEGLTDSMLNEEERRRMLRSHKIKITLLKGSAESSTSQRKSPKKAKNLVMGTSHPENYRQLSSHPLSSFKDLRAIYRISRRLAENLNSQGYSVPSEVQTGSLPILLGSDEHRGLPYPRKKNKERKSKSDIDLLTVAPTGSGKSLAFLIPVLQGLIERRHVDVEKNPQTKREHQLGAIIIAPTHELADQLVNEARKLATGTGIKVAGMRKGMRLYHEDASDMQSQDIHADESSEEDTQDKRHSLIKADVIVSTPLILLNSLKHSPDASPTILPSVQYLVLDEADILLDPLFRPQTLSIWTACVNPALQASLWSATIGSSIEALAQDFILDRRKTLDIPPAPHYIIRLVVGLKDSALSTISHRLVYTATEKGKLLALRQLFHPTTSLSSASIPTLQPPFLIFTQTISRAIALHSELLYDIPVEAGGSTRIAVLHSDLTDSARSAIMARFRTADIWILITTDLLSRGVDFRGVNGVVSYDVPNSGAAYVHRAGRTGRAGREGGVAVTFYTKEDIPYVKSVANVIAKSQKSSGKPPDGSGVEKWLLDALPTVSKNRKKELKRKGVEARRPTKGAGREARKMRISTKSGFDRRIENNRRGAKTGAKNNESNEASDGEWGGLDD